MNCTDPAGRMGVVNFLGAQGIRGKLAALTLGGLAVAGGIQAYFMTSNVLTTENVGYIRTSAAQNQLTPELLAAFVETEAHDRNLFDLLEVPKGRMTGNSSIGLGQVGVNTALRYNLVDSTDRKEVIRRLRDPKWNIEATARYIRHLANTAEENVGRWHLEGLDTRLYQQHASQWNYNNAWTVKALASEYTSTPWDNQILDGLGDKVLRSYEQICAAGVFHD